MIYGLLGDIHGHYDELQRVFDRYPLVDYWLQVGDLGDVNKEYPKFPDNFYFIQGNHENWGLIYGIPGYLRNGSYKNIGDCCVASMGGNYSPKNYDLKRENLSPNRRKHFLKEEFDSLYSRVSEYKADILITHEAPSPFRKREGYSDSGQPLLTDLLKSIKPKIHFFGHHHYFGIYEYDGNVSIGLEYGFKSVVFYDSENNQIRKEDVEN